MSEALEPFEVRVADEVLGDLRDRLMRTRFPDEIDGAGWDYGMPMGYLRELVGYWRDSYDWHAQQARLNEYPQFRTRIDGQSVHFIHARSGSDGAFPLLIIHGWPGSVVEFLDVIPRLTAAGFDVVAPSLPGYGFSEPPRTRGWDVRRTAEAFMALMARLGYSRYGAQGGDWGAMVSTWIGALDPGHCAAVHVNMATAVAPEDAPPLTEEEQSDLAAMQHFMREEAGYASEQMTKPQTLGAGLNDSPAGLCAWIVEKFRTWSDCDGHPENCFTRDQLLTNVMLYWVTGTAASAARLYWEHMHGASARPPYVAVPTGVARYPKEPLRYPRAWVERQYHVTHWAVMPRGGHFAAMEEPDLLVADVREFFRPLR